MNLSTYIAIQCDPSLQLGKARKTTHHSRSDVFLCWLRPAKYDRLALDEGPQLLCAGDLYVACILYATFTNRHWRFVCSLHPVCNIHKHALAICT